jgi:hypothetical protein
VRESEFDQRVVANAAALALRDAVQNCARPSRSTRRRHSPSP